MKKMYPQRGRRGGIVAAIVFLLIGGLALITGCEQPNNSPGQQGDDAYTIAITQPPVEQGSFTVKAGNGDNVSAGPITGVAEGTAITLTATAEQGYRFVKFTVHGAEQLSGSGLVWTFNMPSDHVTVVAVFASVELLHISVEQPEEGRIYVTVEGDDPTDEDTTAYEGDEIVLTADPAAPGFKVVFTVTKDSGGNVQTNDEYDGETFVKTVFAMPPDDVTVTAEYASVEYDIAVGLPFGGSFTVQVENGQPAFANTKAKAGQTITLEAAPNPDLDLSFTVIGAELNPGSGHTRTFTMPANNVSISAIIDWDLMYPGAKSLDTTKFQSLSDAAINGNTVKWNGTGYQPVYYAFPGDVTLADYEALLIVSRISEIAKAPGISGDTRMRFDFRKGTVAAEDILVEYSYSATPYGLQFSPANGITYPPNGEFIFGVSGDQYTELINHPDKGFNLQNNFSGDGDYLKTGYKLTFEAIVLLPKRNTVFGEDGDEYILDPALANRRAFWDNVTPVYDWLLCRGDGQANYTFPSDVVIAEYDKLLIEYTYVDATRLEGLLNHNVVFRTNTSNSATDQFATYAITESRGSASWEIPLTPAVTTGFNISRRSGTGFSSPVPTIRIKSMKLIKTSPPGPQSYTVTFTSPSTGGSFTVKAGDDTLASGASVLEETQITLDATPAQDYDFVKFVVTGAVSNEYTDDHVTFTMPAANVTITAVFRDTNMLLLRKGRLQSPLGTLNNISYNSTNDALSVEGRGSLYVSATSTTIGTVMVFTKLDGDFVMEVDLISHTGNNNAGTAAGLIATPTRPLPALAQGDPNTTDILAQFVTVSRRHNQNGQFYNFNYPTSNNRVASTSNTASSITAPSAVKPWRLKMTRTGNTISTAVTELENTFAGGDFTVPDGPLYIGLHVSEGASSGTSTAQFTNFSVNGKSIDLSQDITTIADSDWSE